MLKVGCSSRRGYSHYMKAREILPTFIFLCDGTSHNPSGKRSEVMRTSLFEMDVPI